MDLAGTIKTELENTSEIAALLIGGIYTRSLLQAGPNVYGATPQAFSANQLGVRPSAVIRNEPSAPVAGTSAHYAQTQPVAIWLYVPATDDGKALLNDVERLITQRFSGYLYTTNDGFVGELSTPQITGYRDAVEYPGTLVDTVRFIGTALTRIPA